MKPINDALDTFICPTTSRLATDNALPKLKNNFVWEGDENNRPRPSSALIYMQIDINSLLIRIKDIRNTPFVLNKTNPKYPNSQALDTLEDGIMLNDKGMINTEKKITQSQLPSLKEGNVWVGDKDGIKEMPYEHDNSNETKSKALDTLTSKYDDIEARMAKIEQTSKSLDQITHLEEQIKKLAKEIAITKELNK